MCTLVALVSDGRAVAAFAVSTVVAGGPMVTVAGGVTTAGGADGGALDVRRPAERIPATAPPPTSAATTTHFALPFDAAAAIALFGSAMYCDEIVPARACSLEATIRMAKRPGIRFTWRPRSETRPPSMSRKPEMQSISVVLPAPL